MFVWAAVLVLTAAVVSIVLGRPKEVTHPVLGTEWQCKHLAILTSCSRIAPARQSSRANPYSVPPGVIRASW
jgi:hypothetical protein